MVGLMTGRKSTTIVKATSKDSVDRKMVVPGSVSTAESVPAVEDPMVIMERRYGAKGLLSEGASKGDGRGGKRGCAAIPPRASFIYQRSTPVPPPLNSRLDSSLLRVRRHFSKQVPYSIE